MIFGPKTRYIVKIHVLGASQEQNTRGPRGPAQWAKNLSRGQKNPTFYLAPVCQNTTKIRPERRPNGANRRFSASASCATAGARHTFYGLRAFVHVKTSVFGYFQAFCSECVLDPKLNLVLAFLGGFCSRFLELFLAFQSFRKLLGASGFCELLVAFGSF